MDNKYEQILDNLCEELKCTFKKTFLNISEDIKEICIRVNKPIVIIALKGSFFLRKDGKLTSNLKLPLKIVSKNEIQNCIKIMCQNSIYSHIDELKSGFLTIKGGHRVGICGTAVLKNKKIINIRDISSLNIRIAREIKNSADTLLSIIGMNFRGIIIAGKPLTGKTTVLREIARILSMKNLKISIIDERNEIAGTYEGISQNDVGFCDVLNGYPKTEGIIQATRALSPDIIVCDEIINKNDVSAIKNSANSGVRFVITLHINNINDLKNRIIYKKIIKTGSFDILAVLDDKNNPGKISDIYKIDKDINKISKINM